MPASCFVFAILGGGLDGYEIAPYDEAELQRLRGLGINDPEDDPTVRIPAPLGRPNVFLQRFPRALVRPRERHEPIHDVT